MPEIVDVSRIDVGQVRLVSEHAEGEHPLDIAAAPVGSITEAELRRKGFDGAYVLLTLGAGLFIWGTGWPYASAADLGKVLILGVSGAMLNLLKK